MGPTCTEWGWESLWCPAGTGVYSQTVYEPSKYIVVTKHTEIGGRSTSGGFWQKGL